MPSTPTLIYAYIKSCNVKMESVVGWGCNKTCQQMLWLRSNSARNGCNYLSSSWMLHFSHHSKMVCRKWFSSSPNLAILCIHEIDGVLEVRELYTGYPICMDTIIAYRYTVSLIFTAWHVVMDDGGTN